MLWSLKSEIKKQLKHKLLRMADLSTDKICVPTALNDNFNMILRLAPRVTSCHEHVTLFVLSALTKGDVIEVGSYLCYSSVIMASAFGNSGRKLYAIDTFDRERGWRCGGSDGWIYKDFSQLDFARKIIRDCNLTDSIVLKKGNSSDVANELSSLTNVQLIFIDGDHSYSGCRQDLLNYAPILIDGGFLVMDDYIGSEHVGVKSAVDEFLENNDEYEPRFLIDTALVLYKSTSLKPFVSPCSSN